MDFKEEIERDAELGTARLFAAYGARLWNTAWQMCRNAVDAEDLAMRTIEQAVAKIGQYNAKMPIFPWMCGILVNTHRADLRLKGRNAIDFMAEPPDTVDARPDAAELLSRESDARAVHAAMARLKEPDRTLLSLRYFNELTVPQIAKIVKLPEGTVKRRIHEAKIALRANLVRTIRPERA